MHRLHWLINRNNTDSSIYLQNSAPYPRQGVYPMLTYRHHDLIVGDTLSPEMRFDQLPIMDEQGWGAGEFAANHLVVKSQQGRSPIHKDQRGGGDHPPGK